MKVAWRTCELPAAEAVVVGVPLLRKRWWGVQDVEDRSVARVGARDRGDGFPIVAVVGGGGSWYGVPDGVVTD